MKHPGVIAFCATVAASTAFGQGTLRQWYDDSKDAAIRLTDPGADGVLHPDGVIPDLLHVSLAGWAAAEPQVNPYNGAVIPGDEAHLMRLTVTFRGLINPPGTIGVNGQAYDPFVFGPSPAFGTLDFNVDEDHDTGGELGGAATQRYLANVARFGRVAPGDLADRTARTNADVDLDFTSGPQFERSGADFAFSICGCWETEIVSEGGDGDGLFEEDETWIVRGRFFERAQGYEGASFMSGGSDFFLYDPMVNVRYQHSAFSNTTTLTLIFPLDMIGAAMLLGGDVQEMDFCIDECVEGSDHFSVAEALNDVITYVDVIGVTGPTKVLAENWAGRDPLDYLDPTTWTVTALFGMAYLVEDDAFYAWTDTGMNDELGDVDGDGAADETDEAMLIAGVYALDGQSGDADGVVNGVVKIGTPGLQFNVLDLDGDATIRLEDRYTYGDPADLNDDGQVDLLDFISFQVMVHTGDPGADFNLDQKVDVFDFIAFQVAASK